jgi:ribosome biogenesis SPOUT family RNA methylase Rps3
MVIYVIEHLEENLWPWCILEYMHLAAYVGEKNCWFTNVKSSELPGKAITESVTNIGLTNVCVLDPAASVTLTSNEAKQFDYFVFGGILGNDPPEARTGPELTFKMKGSHTVRNIGKEQMSTDTAVYVVHGIVHGKEFEQFEFIDGIEIPLGKNESTLLPYRYVIVDGKPWISEKLIKYIQKMKGL